MYTIQCTNSNVSFSHIYRLAVKLTDQIAAHIDTCIVLYTVMILLLRREAVKKIYAA